MAKKQASEEQEIESTFVKNSEGEVHEIPTADLEGFVANGWKEVKQK